MSRQSRRRSRKSKQSSGRDQVIARTQAVPSVFSAREWLFGSLLVLTVILVYQQAWNAGYIWDDDVYVTKNPLLTASDGFKRIWFSLDSPSQYFPLVYTTFRIERGLWGLDPTGYHWVNLFLHAANALLVWQLLRRLQVPGAWLAGMIFALHPVQVESVAWITERKNVLMGFFFLFALLAWCSFLDTRGRRRWLFYGLSIVTYAAALSAKTTACTLPAALLLILWFKKERIRLPQILQVVPFVVLGFAMGLITIWWERYHQGTRGGMFSLGPIERLLIASRAIWFYLGKLFWPVELTFIYPQWKIDASDPCAYLWIVASILACLVIYVARRRLGRGLEVSATFFAATLAPLLGFIMLYTFRYTYVADHYQYLACIGPIALVSAGFVRLSEWGKHGREMAAITGALIVGVLATLTWRQCAMYSSPETLWRMTLSQDPHSWMARNNLGVALLEKGHFNEALADFQQALEVSPDKVEILNDIGDVLLRMGRIDESFQPLQKALEMQPNRPDVLSNLGNALLRTGHVDEAIVHLQKALEVDPSYIPALTNLGAALLQIGRVDESFAHLQRAVEIDPSYKAAHFNLANTLLQMGRVDEAVSHLRKVMAIDPGDAEAQKNMAWVLATSPEARIRDGAKAVELAERANQLTESRDPIVVVTLAAAYAETGRFPEAIRTAETALQLATDSGNLGLAEIIRAHIELYHSGNPVRDIR